MQGMPRGVCRLTYWCGGRFPDGPVPEKTRTGNGRLGKRNGLPCGSAPAPPVWPTDQRPMWHTVVIVDVTGSFASVLNALAKAST